MICPMAGAATYDKYGDAVFESAYRVERNVCAMNASRSPTPRATPLVRPPRSPSEPPSRGAALYGPILILTAVGQHNLAVGNVVVVGRDPSCDLLLNDPLVSRHHVQIFASKERAVLEDLMSTNGAYVNCIRVLRNVCLHAGDRILLGTIELSVFPGDSV